MSAVSKKLMPASSAASTTALVSARPIRMPKLLQPRPTTLTSSEPIVRVSTDALPPGSRLLRAGRVGSTVPATSDSGTTRDEEAAMAAGAVDVTIAAPPDEVWAKVGDFAGIDVLFPGLESFRLEGDDRIIGMFGMEIRERLLARDEEARVLTYSVVDGVPIESHTATISVEPDGAGTKVIWAYDVSPDEMAPIFGDTYKGALAALENSFS